ncbi:MAG: hypothetical protein M3Y09_07680 [Actinomycetota bacterium]|nr:hypothetical protein [Actinomycetota bacterium]
MIVRVFSDGQYEVPHTALELLHNLDRECQDALQAGDSQRFHARYAELLAHIHSAGHELADDDLRGSDLMLPPPDVSLAEAQTEFSEHGLLPE